MKTLCDFCSLFQKILFPQNAFLNGGKNDASKLSKQHRPEIASSLIGRKAMNN